MLMIIYCADHLTLKEKVSGFPLIKILLLFFIYLLFASIIAPAISDEVYGYQWYKGIFNENRNLFYLLRVLFLIITYYVFMMMVNNYKNYMVAINALALSTICYLAILAVLSIYNPDIILWKGMRYYPNRLRLKGFSSEPNSFSAWLYSVYFLFLTLSFWEIREINVSKKTIRICFGILSLLLLFFVLSTTAYIAIAIGMVCFFYNYNKHLKIQVKNSHKKLFTQIKLIGLLGAIIFPMIFFVNYLFPFFQNIFSKKIISLFMIHDISLTGPRGALFMTNLHMFLKHPVLGVGIGRSAYFTNVYYPYDKYLADFKPYLADFDSLNSYALFFCETGIIGILFIIYIGIKIFQYCNFTPLNRNGKIISLYTTSTLVAYLVAMLGSGDIHYQLYFVLSIVMLVRNFQINKELDSSKFI